MKKELNKEQYEKTPPPPPKGGTLENKIHNSNIISINKKEKNLVIKFKKWLLNNYKL